MTPWEQLPIVWKSESAYWTWVRGGFRSVWMTHPVKLAFMSRKAVKLRNPNPNGRNEFVKGFRCERCNCECFSMASKDVKRIEKLGVKINTVQVNHRKMAGSLKSKEDLGSFAANLLFVSFDDLEIICTECHSYETHSQRYGMTIEEAKYDKKAIEIEKLKTDEVKKFIRLNGLEPSKKKEDRRKQLIEILKKKGVDT